jgi:hypothetical protein
MTETRLLTENDHEQVYELIYSHSIIAGIKVEKPSLEDFKNKIQPEDIMFGHFEDTKLVALLSSRALKSFPSWFIVMLTSKRRQDYFDIRKTGLVEVMDKAIEYWEDCGIYSIFTIQSVKHRRILTDQLKKYSPGRFSQYQVPAPTVEVIKKGTESKSLVIKNMCQGNVYDEDKIVKWIFRKDFAYNKSIQDEPDVEI